MRRVLLMVAVVGMMVSVADAGTLYIKWADTVDQAKTLSVGQTADIEVWVVLDPVGDTLSTVFFENEAILNMSQIGQVHGPTGWSQGTDVGVIGPGTQVAFASTPGFDLTVAGTYLIGTYTVQLDDNSDGLDKEIVIADGTWGLETDVPGAWTFGPLFNGAVPNFLDIGRGCPGIVDAGLGGCDRDPLIVVKGVPGAIPTVSEWGMIVMTVLLMGGGAMLLSRKRAAVA